MRRLLILNLDMIKIKPLNWMLKSQTHIKIQRIPAITDTFCSGKMIIKKRGKMKIDKQYRPPSNIHTLI